MATISCSDIHAIKLQTLDGPCQVMLSAHGVIYVSTLQLFHIFNSSLSVKAMHILNHMWIE